MTTLRRRSARAFRLLLSVATPAFVLAAFALTAAQPGHAAATGTRSHTHHTLSTALPASSFVATSTPRGSRHRRGASSAHSTNHGTAHGSTHSSAHSSAALASPRKGSAHAGSSRHGHAHQPEPADDDRPVMWRAGRRSGHPDRQNAAFGARRRPLHGHADTTVAEVTGRSADGGYLVHLRSRAAAHAAYPAYSRYQPIPVPVAAARGYTQGVAHPDGGEEADPRSTSPAHQVSIGTAIVMAAPSESLQSLQSSRPQPQVPATARIVSGFGSEVALASPDPGMTRRRNHPVPASALPGFAPPAPPATLEDRDALTLGAVSPAVLPEIYDRDGRLVTPAPLKGSHDVLVHQNVMATADGLERIQDDGELDRLRLSHQLINLPESESLRLNPDLPGNRRCARPWTVLFAIDIAHDFYNRFHQPLQINSAVRTVSYQARLQRINGNAAAIDGDGASPHLTGQALDFGKRGMSSAEIAWMRAYLLPLMEGGKIDVEEEFQQACFHISVYRRYAGTRGPAQVVAQVRPGS